MINGGMVSSRFIQGMAMAIASSGLAFAALGHEYYAAGFKIVHPWAMPTGPADKSTVAFVRFEEISSADRLIGARSPVAGKIEIRGPIAPAKGVQASPPMASLKALDLPVGGEIEMSQQGVHLVLDEVKGPLLGDRSYPLTLVFEKAGTIETMMAMSPF